MGADGSVSSGTGLVAGFLAPNASVSGVLGIAATELLGASLVALKPQIRSFLHYVPTKCADEPVANGFSAVVRAGALPLHSAPQRSPHYLRSADTWRVLGKLGMARYGVAGWCLALQQFFHLPREKS